MQNINTDSIKKGMKFLTGLVSYSGDSCPSLATWQPEYSYATTFVPALVLNSLSKTTDAEPIRQKLSQSLLRQRSENWSFNYWLRNSKEGQIFPYPDDLDDTFCALIGLYQHDPALVDAKALGRIVHILLATETAVGGPYQTWLANSDSNPDWQSVDLAVNANVAYFLSLIGSPSQPLLTWLESKIMAGDYRSAYYPSDFPVWYYLARICPGQCRAKLRRDIKNKTPRNALEYALVGSALRHLGAPVAHLQQSLRALQSSDGSWPASAFCRDPSRYKRKYYHGSQALTTAFAIEALQDTTPLILLTDVSSDRQAVRTAIMAQAEHDHNRLQPDLQTQVSTLLQKITKGDTKQQITLLAYDFGHSLKVPPQVSEKFYVNLGLANLYGWAAYTVYDDFLDQSGQPAQLSAANYALRQSLAYFERALPHPGFLNLVQQTFNTIDAANAWEVQNCRSPKHLPFYGQGRRLAERSLGHTLTPIAALLQTGQPISGSIVQATQRAIRHYLIARQLDDDAHDWQEDYRRGHMSSVVTAILRANSHHDMRTEFWQHSLPKICGQMLYHVRTGRRELNKVTVLRTNNVISQLFDDIEISAQTSLQKQAEASQFLASYQQKTGQLLNSN